MKFNSLYAIALALLVSGLAVASPGPVEFGRSLGIGGHGKSYINPYGKGRGKSHSKAFKKCIDRECNAMCIRDGYTGGVCLKNAGIE
ncbi:hypothetical protein McanMca71_006230 [Microsporum canis]